MSQPHFETLPLLVDGTLTGSRSTATQAVVNPSTGDVIGRIPAGCDDDVDGAVASARDAYRDGRWSGAPPSQRKKVLARLAELVAEHSRELDLIDASEMGKPIGTAYCNAAAASGLITFYSEAADKIQGETYASDIQSLVLQRRVPRGVVAAVVPWNFPSFNAAYKIAPALAAGNSVILKPSELSPGSALRIGQLALEAGLPAGVLNVVPGLGANVGRALALHPAVDMIAFTGSTAVGKLMLQYAGQSNMKVIQAECGGKSPQILFDDGVDLDAACDWIASVLLINQGQLCSVGSRLLVQKSIESAVVERVAKRVQNIAIGNAAAPETTFGPLASERQLDRVTKYIDDAKGHAEMVTGGQRLTCDGRGFFVQPTIFRDVQPGSPLAQEEIFGPVLSVMTFDTVDEAASIANDTVYGLSSYVWTGNTNTAMRMIKMIRSAVMVNSCMPKGEGAGHAASMEPAGQSGVGAEGGLVGLENYMRRQLVQINHM